MPLKETGRRWNASRYCVMNSVGKGTDLRLGKGATALLKEILPLRGRYDSPMPQEWLQDSIDYPFLADPNSIGIAGLDRTMLIILRAGIARELAELRDIALCVFSSARTNLCMLTSRVVSRFPWTPLIESAITLAYIIFSSFQTTAYTPTARRM